MPGQRRFSVSLSVLFVALLVGACRWGETPAPDTDKARTRAAAELAGPEAPAVQYDCRWAHAPITIDGRRDEPSWSSAQPINGFSRSWEDRASRTPQSKTKAWLLWDRQFIYYFAEMEDRDVFADVRQHDGQTWSNDVFELFFKPAEDKPGYYEFQVNALGTQLDMFLPRRDGGGYDRYKDAMPFHMESQVVVDGTLNRRQDHDKGWSVEGRIAWRDFLRTGGRPVIDETWHFALCRYDYSIDTEQPDLSSAAPLTQANFHRYEDYAALRFVGPRETPRPPGVQPYGMSERIPLTTSRVIGSPDPPLPYTVKKAYPKLKLNYPVAARAVPGSDYLIFIDEKSPYAPTKLRRMKDDPDVTEYETLLDFDKALAYDFCFHPDYRRNGYLYIGSNGPGPDDKKHSRITRYYVDPNPPYKFDATSAKVIIEWPSNGHNGVAIAFAPDGMLYVTSGDGTSDSDTDNVGQRLDLLTSKVLRIDVDHPEGGKMYSVPKDNPFVGRKNARPETWAYGMRNPWRIAIDQQNGNVWVGNNGQDLWEQVYLIERGANYGWSVYEGSHPFYINRELGPTPLSRPIFEHSHSESRSLTGGVIYRGDKLPELKGAYLYGDHSTGKIWGGLHDGKKVVWHKELADTPFNITGFALDRHGEILVLDHRGEDQGNFYHLVPVSKNEGGDAFPRKLSDTGLFRSIQDHQVEPALIPYSVNSPQWADGCSHQQRYLGLPGADAKIEVTASNAWKFPERTVLVKSLAIEIEEGNPASRRWLETQLLTRQQGEWVGYTYAWNDEGTDATLVPEEGMEKLLEINTPVGTRKQVWHYASRADCMGCHSRAAGHVLGMTTLQLNKDHDYDGVVDNQLRTLEYLGILQVDWYGEARTALRYEVKASGLSDEEVTRVVDDRTSTKGQRGPRPSGLFSRSLELLPRLADPADTQAILDARTRSYLHANCAHCHVVAGGGNAQINLEYSAAVGDMKLVDVKPVHAQFDIPDARLVVPGDPYRSVLYYRLATSGSGRMPKIGSNVVNHQALRLVRDWIAAQPQTPQDQADQESLRAARRQEDEAIAKLGSAATAGDEEGRAIDKLLTTTSGALALLDALEEGWLPSALRDGIIARATAHERLQTRDLFERFLPPDQRVVRLGTSVDAQQILTMPGDVQRGRALFADGAVANCKSCHRLGDGPEQMGPDLSDVGKRLAREQILESILEPSRKIDEKYNAYILQTVEGKTYTGLLVHQDDETVLLRDSENRAHRFARTEIDDFAVSAVSLMPRGLVQHMTAQQLADLLALLEASR